MGSGRDKRKKSKGHSTAGQGAAKTDRKTQQNEEKKKRRQEGKGDDDIDAILTQLDLKEKQARKVEVVTNCKAPEPRVCGLWLPLGDLRKDEILLFGGELLDKETGRVAMFSEVFTFNTAKAQWTHVKSKGPHPRSACSGAVHKGHLYIFGGEFTSPNQEKFKHFRDLWRLDLTTWEWEELKLKRGPSARSGHRMLSHKGKIWLFGGYYDTGEALPKYYCDLWCFDPGELQWTTVGDMKAKWPKGRSGYQWVAHEGMIVMHGGYTKVVDDDEADMEHGIAMDDTWVWHIAEQTWERKAKAGMAPSKRASFAMALHKTKALLFGGTADEEGKGGETLISNFFNDLYQLNLTQWRWYPMAMRAQKKGAEEDVKKLHDRVGKVVHASHSDTEPTDAEKRALAATLIQAHYRGHVVRQAMKHYRIGGQLSEVLYSPAAYGVDLSSQNAPKPRARINANMCVVKNTLWLFGGIVEIGDKEVTLDDMWSLDLAKLNGWNLVKDNTAGHEDFAEGEDSASESSGDDADNECSRML